MIHKGNTNYFIVEKNDEQLLKLPVTVLVLLLMFAFWVTVPLLVVGLFFGLRYSFKGPDMECGKVNDAMETVAKAAEDIKNDMKRDEKAEKLDLQK